MKIEDVRKCLQEAHRFGSVPDIPEGTYYIQISDTLALHMIEALNAVSKLPDKWRKETTYPDDFKCQLEEEMFTCVIDKVLRQNAEELDNALNAVETELNSVKPCTNRT